MSDKWSCQYCTALMENGGPVCHGCGQDKHEWSNNPDPDKMALGRRWLEEYSRAVVARLDAQTGYSKALRAAGLRVLS